MSSMKLTKTDSPDGAITYTLELTADELRAAPPHAANYWKMHDKSEQVFERLYGLAVLARAIAETRQ